MIGRTHLGDEAVTNRQGDRVARDQQRGEQDLLTDDQRGFMSFSINNPKSTINNSSTALGDTAPRLLRSQSL